MKKLIAKRPIQYQGKLYARGDAVPANDPVMTAAWLRAASAAFEEAPERRKEPPTPDSAEVCRQTAEHEASSVLEALGVAITDEAGDFVGKEALTEQLRILGQNLMQEYEDVIPPAPGAPARGELPEDKVLDTDPNGHFTQASLSRLTKAELMELAQDMKVDISGCRTNAERVEALAAVDAETALGGGEPPPEPAAPEAVT